MSGILQGRVWYLAELSTSEKAVLAALADHAHDDGSNCFPSMARIAWKASMTDRGVRKIIVRLEELGYVKRKIKVAGDVEGNTPNGYKTNLFFLNIPDQVPGHGEKPWEAGARPWEKTQTRPEPPFRTAPSGETVIHSEDQTGTPVPLSPEPPFRAARNPGSAKPSLEPSMKQESSKSVDNSGPSAGQLALANEAYCTGKGTNPDTLTARRPKGRSDDDPAHRLAAWYASVARPDLDFDGLSENDWRCRWYAPAKELLRSKPDAEIRELVGWVFDPETRPYWRGLLRESIDSLRFQLLTTRDRRLDRDFQNHRATLAAGEPVRPKRAAGFGEVELLVEQVSKAWSRARAEADGPDVIDAFKANIAGLPPAAQAAALDVRRMIAMGARTFDVKAAFSAAYESHVNGSAGEAA